MQAQGSVGKEVLQKEQELRQQAQDKAEVLAVKVAALQGEQRQAEQQCTELERKVAEQQSNIRHLQSFAAEVRAGRGEREWGGKRGKRGKRGERGKSGKRGGGEVKSGDGGMGEGTVKGRWERGEIGGS
ncbi:unnamed protein product [Closterium sp. NIES-53]